MSELARDVAKELERRRRRRRLIFAAVWIALIALALVYVRCGGSWGLGGRGSGAGSGPGVVAASDAGPHRCAIRIAANGVTVDGRAATREAAVATCRTAGGADVVVTGDAREGDWEGLRAALEAAKVPVFVRESAR